MICQNSDCGARYAKASGGGKCVCLAFLCPTCWALALCPECEHPRGESVRNRGGRPRNTEPIVKGPEKGPSSERRDETPGKYFRPHRVALRHH